MTAAVTASRPFRWGPGLFNLGVVLCVMAAASFVPSDTSLSEMRTAGIIRACVPLTRPPLVTGDPDRPGHDIAILREVAERLGVRLGVSSIPAMGADFNPRNWGINRGLCDVIAGGVVDNPQTRGFLQPVPTGAATGWAIVAREGVDLGPEARVAVFPGEGLDRLALSGVLRARGIRPTLSPNVTALTEALASGEVDVGIASMAAARQVAASLPSMSVTWLNAEGLGRSSFAIGVWKGDLALKRAVAEAVDAMATAGTLARLRAEYGLAANHVMNAKKPH